MVQRDVLLTQWASTVEDKLGKIGDKREESEDRMQDQGSDHPRDTDDATTPAGESGDAPKHLGAP